MQLRRSDLDLQRRMRQQEAKPLGPTLGEFYSTFMGLPGLRGLWYPGSQDENGAIYDRSGQGRTLTRNGNPMLKLYNNLVPEEDLDGTGDYYSRADEAGLDITGTETTIVSASRGLTLGVIGLAEDFSSSPGLLSKFAFTAGNQRSYMISFATSGALVLSISSDGTAGNQQTVTSTNVIATGGRFFSVGRFTPSTELMVNLNGTQTLFTTSVKASLFAGTAAFQMGALDAGTRTLNGNINLAFLCAALLPDALLSYLFNRSRVLFGI